MTLQRDEWVKIGPVARRTYPGYREYSRHQASKLDTDGAIDIVAYDEIFYEALKSRLVRYGTEWRGRCVLCLGARSGAEVRAFLHCGAFAVGVDLNPGRGNRMVLKGDFHKLIYRRATVDAVFTNSLDHVYSISTVLAEVRRVLRRSGTFIVEAVRGYEEGGRAGDWESFAWAKVDDLVAIICGAGFELVERSSFDTPWPGDHLEFRA